MVLKRMSEHTEFGTWSTDEADLLDNIDKQVQLVSTSSSSRSPSSHTKEDSYKVDEELRSTKMDAVLEVSENSSVKEASRELIQSPHSLIDAEAEAEAEPSSPSDVNKSKLHSSCNDLLSMMPTENKFDIKFPKAMTPTTESKCKKEHFKRSASCVTLTASGKVNTRGKYDHIQSKVKEYFKDKGVKNEIEVQKPKNDAAKECKEKPKKEEYLEEINKRLTRELDEKNAILTKLQENYEQLLFKYAEAQNRIDQLRFKSINGSTECTSRTGFKPKSSRTSVRIPLNSFYGNYDPIEGKDETQEGKCQKAIVAPFMKENDALQNGTAENPPISRPSSLPIDNSLKIMERDMMKAATPTDSEGVSSVITSMSGHSKILNTLDEENDKKSKAHYQSSDFILENSTPVNDPYDKVKNWQNSLPPLELIETPDTTLYDIPQGAADADVSPSTNYNEVTPCPKVANITPLTEDTFPECFHTKAPDSYHSRSDYQKNKIMSQAVMKKYLRTLSLPGSLSKRNLMSLIYKRKNHHTIDLCVPMRSDFNGDKIEEQPILKTETPSACLIQKRKKRPPFLRSSSLPAYDYDSPKSGSCRNDVFIPPLDLENLTLSDDDSSPQLAYDLSKSNANTSPSVVTSHGGSMDCSFQTLQSGNSCKATISEYSDVFFRNPRPIFHKSTSITPDRSKEMIFPEFNKHSLARENENGREVYIGNDKAKIEEKNWCNVCGQSFSEQENFRYRSNSYQSVEDMKDTTAKSSMRRTKHPFIRSVSFNSETNSPNCFHDSTFSPRDTSHRQNQDSLDKFDIYTNNLKARSQVIMKALTAHVNNS